MMRKVLQGAVIALMLLALAAPAVAQSSSSGGIRGVVRDAQGAVLPGVTVTAYSTALIAGKMTAITDARGAYRFPSLPIGTYVLEAELSGFVKVRQEDVRISIGRELGIDITLPQAKVAEVVTVSAEAPVISAVGNQVSSYFDSKWVERQPLPRNFYFILNAAPGVNSEPTSVLTSNVLAYGGNSARQNAYTIDGVNVSDPGGGSYWVLPSIQWMEEVRVGGLGADAEYGGYTGGIVNGVTKSGGNVFHGGLEYYYQPSSWVSNNNPEGTQETFKFSDLALSLGGKFVEDKLWWFLSGEYWQNTTTPLNAYSSSERRIGRGLGKLTYQASEGNRLSLMAEDDKVVNQNRGSDAYTYQEATYKQVAPNFTASLGWESLINANNYINLRGTYMNGRDDQVPYNGDTPGHIDDANTGIYWANSPFTGLDFRRLESIDGSWNLFSEALFGANDSHSFKFGAKYEVGWVTENYVRSGGFTYYDDSSYCDSWEAYLADPSCGADYIERGYGEINEWLKWNGWAAYAQDSVRLDRFTLNVGLRFGQYNGGFAEGHGDQNVYQVTYWDPRIGFVWDLTGEARTVVKAHWGRYHTGMVAWFWDRHYSGNISVPDQDCYWDPDTQSYSDCDTPVSASTATMGDLSHPYVDETLLTFEQALGRVSSVGLDLIQRNFRSFMVMWNTNDDYETLVAHNNPYGGGDLPVYNLLSEPVFVLTQNNPAFRDFKSVVLRYDKRYADGWQLRASVVWSDNKGNIENDYGYEPSYTDKNGQTNLVGRMTYSTNKWEAKLSASVDLPLNFQLSAFYTYLSGQYWTPYVRVRGLDYNASTGNYIYMVPLGTEKFPERNLIDLRLAWNTSLGKAMNLTVQAECFNCTNSSTVLSHASDRWGDYRISDESWVGPRSVFAAPDAIEQPRQFRAGVRFSF
ncbi:MAG TPA: TonB-dependent receptor [Thermoanaerobaculaceae bacterium]|nr:TonB-dependent receptor [Thermoanaerobaculaceae bacterium]